LRRYVSSEHFSVDGTLLEAWASHNSFKPKDGPPTEPPGRNIEVQWHGEKRSNETHASTTDPQARLARKSNATAAKLCYSGHLLLEHRNALIVDAELTAATGYAERDTAIEMLGGSDGASPRPNCRPHETFDTGRQRGVIAEIRSNRIARERARDGSAVSCGQRGVRSRRGHRLWVLDGFSSMSAASVPAPAAVQQPDAGATADQLAGHADPGPAPLRRCRCPPRPVVADKLPRIRRHSFAPPFRP
jgi:hypothetical protein